MSNEPLGNTTRRGFLGTATAATALTFTAPPAAEAQAPVRSTEEIGTEHLSTTGQNTQPAAVANPDWTRPAAMALPTRCMEVRAMTGWMAD